MKTIQMYNLHLINGDVIPVAEAYELRGKKTIDHLFQNAEDNDVFFISDMLLGACYVPKKNIVYVSTGEVRVNAEPDMFETNICLLRRAKQRGSQD